ncbi:MAG: nucleoside-diphosphate kinase [Armatimonadetes bacterium]|nr:nucleoside-diphosphate kinase [Anaerolineae bacterium]
MERTLIIIKPDGVARGLTGEILRRFEARGLKLVGMKLMQVSRALAEKHYETHQGKPFFEGLVAYITMSPVVVIAFEGPNAVDAARVTIGKTRPNESPAGTIRGDFALDISRNLIHGSDSVENGITEVANFFTESEVVSWSAAADRFILE